MLQFTRKSTFVFLFYVWPGVRVTSVKYSGGEVGVNTVKFLRKIYEYLGFEYKMKFVVPGDANLSEGA